MTETMFFSFIFYDNENHKLENDLSWKYGRPYRSMIKWKAMSWLCSLTDFIAGKILYTNI